MSAALEAALSYARDGWPVLPLRSERKVPDADLVPNGLLNATTEEGVIREWWGRRPLSNVGIALPPGTLVLDVDSEDNAATLNRLAAEYGSLPETMTTVTGSGWFHFWTTVPEDVALAGALDGITLRVGGRSYVVAPPSVVRQPDGSLKPYTWLSEGIEAASLPGEWLALAVKQDKAPVVGRHRGGVKVLPETSRKLIATGAMRGRRSTAWARLVIPCRDAGWTVDDYVAALTDPNNGISERYFEKCRERSEDYARADIVSVWNLYADQPSLTNPHPQDVLDEFDASRPALLIHLNSTPELRKVRPRVLAVWEAARDVAAWHCVYDPLLPSRDVALIAGVADHGKVSKSLAIIADSGAWRPKVASNDEGGGFGARAYTVKTQPNPSRVRELRFGDGLSTPPPSCPVDSPPGLAVWRDKTGYGKGQWLTHSALVCLGEPVTAQDLAAITGQSVKTIGRHLEVQSGLRMAQQTPSGLWVPGSVDPTECGNDDAEWSIQKQWVRRDLDRSVFYGSGNSARRTA